MPTTIGKVARLSRMFRRARKDHVEHRPGRKRREEIRADASNTVAQTVGAGVLSGRERGVRIDVGCDRALRTGARRRERENARSRSNINDPLSPQVEPADECCEALTADEITRVKHGRADGEAEAGCAREARALSRQNEVIGEEVDETTKESAQQTVLHLRTTVAAPASRSGIVQFVARLRCLVHDSTIGWGVMRGWERHYRYFDIDLKASLSDNTQLPDFSSDSVKMA